MAGGIWVTYCPWDYFLSPILHSSTGQVYPNLSNTQMITTSIFFQPNLKIETVKISKWVKFTWNHSRTTKIDFTQKMSDKSVQGVPLPFFLFQKLISQRPKQLGQKFQQFSAFHEVPFHMRKIFFWKNFEKKTLVTKIDQRGRHPSRYHTWSKLLTFLCF